MKYTKDEEARAERSSVKMWPGITAGIIIGLIAFVLSFDALRLVFVACGINPYLSWGGRSASRRRLHPDRRTARHPAAGDA